MLIMSEPIEISYVFCISVFCTHILKIFFRNYCLQILPEILSSKNCSYCIKGSLVKMIFTSGAGIVVTFFLDSNSFFISVSRWHFIILK